MKPGFTSACIAVLAAIALLAGCSTTYHRSPGGPLLAGGCEHADAPPAAADCEQWNELLAAQRDDAGRERIRSRMPAMCVNATARKRAPQCREEQKLDGKGTLMGVVLIGAALLVVVVATGPDFTLSGE